MSLSYPTNFFITVISRKSVKNLNAQDRISTVAEFDEHLKNFCKCFSSFTLLPDKLKTSASLDFSLHIANDTNILFAQIRYACNHPACTLGFDENAIELYWEEKLNAYCSFSYKNL